MLTRWLDRGLGQIVAPDEKHAAVPQPQEAASSFWQTVAPDPNWDAATAQSEGGGSSNSSTGKQPPAEAFLSPTKTEMVVQCVHCGGLTPVRHSTGVLSSPDDSTPVTPKTGIAKKRRDSLDSLVLHAARGTAMSLTSPPHQTEIRQKVFRWCASQRPIADKILAKMKMHFENNPSLLKDRASHLGTIAPDGFTPLMAAAYANHVAAARLVLSLDQTTQDDVDLQGRTPLHIAAEMGSLDIVRLLQTKVGDEAPVDLAGHTPLGRAVTSVHKSAQRNQMQLQQVLFSPGDKSVCGEPTPLKERRSLPEGLAASLRLGYGHASMPGFRVIMEDAVSCHPSDSSSMLLLGVCDGHGDSGQVSKFCGEKVAGILQFQLASRGDEWDEVDHNACWEATCKELDETLRQSNIRGGSTAVWAAISPSKIVVANIGDCRCVLVQRPTKDDVVDSIQDSMKKMSLDGSEKEGTEDGGVEETKGEVEDSPDTGLPFVVTALSEDHKPNLPAELDRIENAGLSVMKETFYDEGVKKTIHKIKLTENSNLSVSRAFGDFEYKGNVRLGPDEQAVVAIPDLRVHTRDSDRDMYLVLACDGIWDVMSNEDVAKFVVKEVEDATQADEADVLPKVGDSLLRECLDRGSRDNLTVVIVALFALADQVSTSGVLERKVLNYGD